MKVTINLESKEDYAVFLTLLNRPDDVQDFLLKSLQTDSGSKPPFEKVLLGFTEDELFKVHYSLFNVPWDEVYTNFVALGFKE